MKYLSIYENFNKITFEITEKDFKEIFDICCVGINLEEDIPIYRSLHDQLKFDGYYLIDPRKYKRQSANTSNYYTLIMDNEKEWKNFPKRKHGIISSLNSSYMDNEFRVVPLLQWDKILLKYNIKEFKNPKWGICSESDIWSSFNYIKEVGPLDADLFNNILDDIYDSLEKIFYGKNNDVIHSKDRQEYFLPNDNFKKFKEELSKITFRRITPSSLNDYYKTKVERLVKVMQKNNFNLYELAKFVYSPEGFKVMTYEEIQENCNEKQINEIWTDTPVLYLGQATERAKEKALALSWYKTIT